MRAVALLAEIDEEHAVNTYDCRVCRAQNLHQTARVCFFDRDGVAARVGAAVQWVTAENLAALLDDGENPLMDAMAIRADGREVCFVPWLQASRINESMAREIEAKEYGQPPRYAKERAVFRVVRGERNQVEREAMKRRKPGNG